MTSPQTDKSLIDMAQTLNFLTTSSLAQLAVANGFANDGDELTPRAIVEGAVNARGILGAMTDAMGKSPRIVLLDCR